MRDLLLRNTDAAITNDDLRLAGDLPDGQIDSTTIRAIFDRIRKQIRHHLLQTVGVSQHRHRLAFGKDELMPRCAELHLLDDPCDQLAQIKRRKVQAELLGVDARYVEQLSD